jgi:hypothetical protein
MASAPDRYLPLNPVLAMLQITGRVIGAYAELPLRLARCRTPLDVWGEQMRLSQRLFSVYRSSHLPGR